MLKNNLEFYQNEKGRLLQAYTRLPEIGPELLNRIDRSSDWINNSVSELESNRFKLFIAGQMNCGKSTLINALLFGKQILPVYDAVMTSAITLIEHVSASPTNQEGFQVEFYSNEEWQAIRVQAQADEQKLNDFVKVQEYVRELGVIPSSVVGTGSKFIAGFDELPAYVTPAMKRREGKYTPFVKSVTIYADNELLRDLVVVDTPGTNDPNEQRARLTEDWIKQADAVVFVSYAGQALPAEDVDFINRFMLHVPSVNRIIAVNKIDTVQGTSELEGYLQDLRNDERESIRQVFSASTPTVMVCALGGLIKGYQGTLPASLAGDRDRLGPLGYLTAERHNMNELRATIEERLLRNKGERILDSHKKRIESTRLLALNAIDGDIEQINNFIFERSKDLKKLQLDAISIEEKRNEIHKLHEDFNQKIQAIIKDLYENKFDTLQVRRLTDLHSNQAAAQINKISSINKIKNDADWIFKSALENATKEFNGTAKSIWKEITHQILQEASIFISNIGFDFLSERQIKFIFDKAKITSIDGNEIDDLNIRKAIDDSENLLFSIVNYVFHSSIGIDKVKEDIAKEIRDSMYNLLLNSQNNIRIKFNGAFHEFINQIELDIHKSFENSKNCIEELIKNQRDVELQNSLDQETVKHLSADRERILSLNTL